MRIIEKLGKKRKTDKGITLIALVITIIVLLILAAISIATLTGENGILTKAHGGKKDSTIGEEKEQIKLAYNAALMKKDYDGIIIVKELNEELNKLNTDAQVSAENPITITFSKTGNIYTIDTDGNINGPINVGEDNPTEPQKSQLEIAKENGTVLSESNTTKIKDKYDNIVVVPEGFKIASDSADDVTGGVVIEDVSYETTAGSQFVWIPVGKIYTNEDKTESEEIVLDRYTFASDGTPTNQSTNVIDKYYQELDISSRGNTTAKDIEAFKESAEKNGGYYIGRYEARTEIERTTKTDGLTQVSVKENEFVYNYVTQLQSAELSREMYGADKQFTSDLMNSYAWDTAIVFIQAFEQDNYSKQNRLNTTFQNKGTNNSLDTTKQDKKCNIWDMASNDYEWITETSSSSYGPCVTRGGLYNYSNYDTSCRYSGKTTHAESLGSFRPILYL